MFKGEETEEVIRRIIGGIYDRPQMYGRTLGELHTLLHYMHLLWSTLTDCEDSYSSVWMDYHHNLGFNMTTGPVTDENRTNPVESRASDGVETLVDYWSTLDDKVGLDWKEFY